MPPDFLADAEEWMSKAQEDLRAVDVLVESGASVANVVTFLAQQAGEKALKAFLTAHGRPFAKTHELERLLPACIALDAGFSAFLTTAPILSQYAVEARYPTGAATPSAAVARQAARDAREIVAFVRQRLAAATPPPTSAP